MPQLWLQGMKSVSHLSDIIQVLSFYHVLFFFYLKMKNQIDLKNVYQSKGLGSDAYYTFITAITQA